LFFFNNKPPSKSIFAGYENATPSEGQEMGAHKKSEGVVNRACKEF
jgi:hypothetical protein